MAVTGYRAEIDAGQRFLEGIEPDENIVLLFHGDADGCCAGAIMYRTLMYSGRELVFPAFTEKGENVYSESLAKRIMVRDPSRLIVLDTGSRPRPMIPNISTMVIDHHQPAGIPPVDVFLNSHGVEPPAPTALFTYDICRQFVPVGGLEWLAAIGTAADLGPDADFEVVRDARDRYGMKAIRETISLINSAYRTCEHDVPTAFQILIHASSPIEIVEDVFPETALLRRYRQEVNSELKKALRVRPKLSGQWALIEFSSPALVHPLVAIIWSRRLPNNIVIAANHGYVGTKVHFSVRSQLDLDLIDELKKAYTAAAGAEFAHGHPRATGGMLSGKEFEALKNALGS